MKFDGRPAVRPWQKTALHNLGWLRIACAYASPKNFLPLSLSPALAHSSVRRRRCSPYRLLDRQTVQETLAAKRFTTLATMRSASRVQGHAGRAANVHRTSELMHDHIAAAENGDSYDDVQDCVSQISLFGSTWLSCLP